MLQPRIFVHLHKNQCTKLDACAIRCLFLGYGLHKKCYKCLDPTIEKTYITMDVTFLARIWTFLFSYGIQFSSSRGVGTWVQRRKAHVVSKIWRFFCSATLFCCGVCEHEVSWKRPCCWDYALKWWLTNSIIWPKNLNFGWKLILNHDMKILKYLKHLIFSLH